jgi:hypothetical protein
MKITKSLERMRDRIGHQLGKRMKRVDLDSVLAMVNLEGVKRTRSMTLPLIAAFGGGVALGLILAPMRGKELLAKVSMLMTRTKRSSGAIGDAAGDMIAEGGPVQSPYDRTNAQRESGPTNAQRKSGRPTEANPKSSSSSAT